MEQVYPVLEFETKVANDGTIVVPAPLAGALRSHKVVVRIVAGSVAGSLRKRGVTEEEIERIALLQLEQRENVVSFLEVEGALACSASCVRRTEKFLKRKNCYVDLEATDTAAPESAHGRRLSRKPVAASRHATA